MDARRAVRSNRAVDMKLMVSPGFGMMRAMAWMSDSAGKSGSGLYAGAQSCPKAANVSGVPSVRNALAAVAASSPASARKPSTIRSRSQRATVLCRISLAGWSGWREA